jgi:hypothetical protein
MHELRVCFRIARFLNRTADYANFFRMQAMLVLTLRAAPVAGSDNSSRSHTAVAVWMRAVRGGRTAQIALAFADSAHTDEMHAIGYSRISCGFYECPFSEWRGLRVCFRIARFLNRTADYANFFRMQAMLELARWARRRPPALTAPRVFTRRLRSGCGAFAEAEQLRGALASRSKVATVPIADSSGSTPIRVPTWVPLGECSRTAPPNSVAAVGAAAQFFRGV